MKLIVGFYQLPPLQKSNCGASVTRIYFVHAWKAIETVILYREYTRIRKVWLVFENSQAQANLQQALSGCPGWINRKQLPCDPDSPCSVPGTHDARLEPPPESSLCSLPVLACTHTYAWYFTPPPMLQLQISLYANGSISWQEFPDQAWRQKTAAWDVCQQSSLKASEREDPHLCTASVSGETVSTEN